ncbi:MAG: hypothetical protein GC208_10520 [Alphaproteobacteria bacterium]|nr:hypothetical protein [Alphaproteobacteria bacterium]
MSATFPAEAREFPVLVDAHPGAAVTDSVVIPNSAPYEVWLTQAPKPGDPITVNCVDPEGSRTLATPGLLQPGQYALTKYGKLTGHSSDAGRTFDVVYTGIGSPVRAGAINALQEEMAAVETYLLQRRITLPVQGFFFGFAAVTAEGSEFIFQVPGPDGAEWNIRGLQILHADSSTATEQTVVRAATFGVGGTGTVIEVTLPSDEGSSEIEAGSIPVVAGDLIYVYVTEGGGHQNIQFALHLQAP